MTSFGILKLGFLITAVTGTMAAGISYLKTGTLAGIARWLAVGAVAVSVIALDVFVVEPNWIEVHHVRIHNAELARVLGDTRIVHISDIHLTQGIGFREKQLMKKVNALKPDLLFFTGDIVDDLSQLEAARKLFAGLNTELGFYGVPGNTDHIVLDSKTLKREMEPAGIEILANENRRIALKNGKWLWLIGVDDPKYNYDRLEKSFAGTPSHAPKIVLAHSPEIFDDLKNANEGSLLLLVGDTHGGQVGIPSLIRLSKYANRTPYMKGLFVSQNVQMVVNRGIGMKTLPIRFLCRPEITVIEVTS